MIQDDVLFAVEPLVKVDALDTLGRIAPNHCIRQGPYVAEPEAVGSIGGLQAHFSMSSPSFLDMVLAT